MKINIESIIAKVDSITLKESKVKLQEQSVMILGYKEEVLASLIEKAMEDKTKEAFKLRLLDLSKALIKVTSTTVTYDYEGIKDELEKLETEIKSGIESAQASFFKVGECLLSASNKIKEANGKQSDFLKWSDENCNIKKAQAYKLMSVYTAFGGESDFKGVSMRVLYTLTSQSNEVVDLARPLAIAGTLDTKALDAILDNLKPAPKAPIVPSTGTVVASGKKEEKEAEKTDKETPAPASDNRDVEDLQTTIASLKGIIEMLKAELKEAKENTSRVPAPPYLAQFDSPNMATCLGLEPERSKDKTAINAAYRSLAKIYTAAVKPIAADKLKIARDTLLGEATA